MTQRFPRRVRVTARAEYDAVKTGGRRISTRHLTLQARPNTLDVDRLGIIATRRLGGAVVRNRAKRRLREIFRLGGPTDSASRPRGLDLVVIPRPELIGAAFPVIRTEFTDALRRLRKILAQ